MENKTISILGCGWYGLPLAKVLLQNGFKVKGSTTSKDKLNLLREAGIESYLIDTELDYFDERFFKCDLLIISIPPKVNSNQQPYTDKIKKVVLTVQKNGVKQVLFISSTGIFQNGNFIVNEDVIPLPNTTVGLALQEAENILRENKYFETTIIRFAGLVGPNRNLAKHFAGKKDISNGFAPINLIHLADCIGLTTAIITKKAFGKIYHGVAPNHPTRKDFYTKACIASGFEKPIFIDELLDWKQITSKNVPEILAYEYIFKDWDKYFELLKQ